MAMVEDNDLPVRLSQRNKVTIALVDQVKPQKMCQQDLLEGF